MTDARTTPGGRGSGDSLEQTRSTRLSETDPPLSVYRYDEVDSTSLEARRLLASKQAPFIVAAKVQTAGRGRMGRNWQSLTGNVMITLVLPSVVESSLPLLPTRAAVLVCEWMSQQFGVFLRLKWPNDLMLGGAKVGGLLCEILGHASEAEGQTRVGPVLVGLGLNVASSPQLPDSARAGQKATALNARYPHLHAEDLVTSLAKHVTAVWNKLILDNQRLLQRAEAWSLGRGQLWLEKKTGSRWLLQQALDESGQLRLIDVHTSQPLPPRTSVDHGLQWYDSGRSVFAAEQRKISGDAGQSDLKSLPVVVWDCGNSASKWSVMSVDAGGKVEQHLRLSLEHTGQQFSHEQRPAWDKVGRQLKSAVTALIAQSGRQVACPSPELWPMFCGSVNPSVSEPAGRFFESEGWQAVSLTKHPVRSHFAHSGYDLQQLGLDRLAAIEGVLLMAEGAKACAQNRRSAYIVVSLGTATTIDAYTPEGGHLGGMILPGLKTALNALAQSTDRLPLLDCFETQASSCQGAAHEGSVQSRRVDEKDVQRAEEIAEEIAEERAAKREHAPALPAWGQRGTHDAMRSGVLQMTVGAITQTLQLASAQAQCEDSSTWQLYLTGGFAQHASDYICQHLQAYLATRQVGVRVSVQPDLVHYGYLSMVLG